MTDPELPRRHRWLKWVGLQEPQAPPPDPDEWTPVASDLRVEDAETGASEEASRITTALSAAGIESHQRVYLLQNDISTGRVGLRLFGPGPPAAERIRLAVVVHNRDLDRAREMLAKSEADGD